MREPAHRFGPRPLDARRLLLVPLAVGLLSCGGGGDAAAPPTTPPGAVGQTVRVTVATTGVSVDEDGYTVRLGTRSAAVPATGTAVFDNVPAGNYPLTLDGVADNCQLAGNAPSSVVVSASSGTQSALSVDCTIDFRDGLSTVACTELSLAATSGVPMDRIAAGTVPAGLEAPLAARVLTPDGVTLGYAWFEEGEQGALQLVTPLHPSGSMAGGEVLIRATDGTVACAPVPFTIAPLPASPGELGAVVDGLQEVIRRQAAVLQTTPSVLQSTAFADLDEVLLPLAIVQWVVDHPQNTSSLRRLADGTGATTVRLPLAEALLARTNVRDALAARLGASPNAALQTVSQVDPSTCTPEAVGPDAQRLSDCMNAASEILGLLFGVAESAGDQLGAAIVLLQTVGVGLPLENVLASLGWSAIQLELRTWATLPAFLDSDRGRLELTKERFQEDDPSTGTWSASVWAYSPGWDIAVRVFGGALESKSFDAILRVLPESKTKFTDIEALLAGPVRAHLPSLAIESRAFGPVKVDDPEWSEVEYLPFSSENTSVVKVDHTTYKAERVGTTSMQVNGPRANGERRFGGNQFFMSQRVVVDSIRIRVEPSDTLMIGGTTATFRVTVDNALFPDSIQALPPAQGTLGAFTQSPGANNQFTMEYTAPTDPNVNTPARLKVQHTAQSGARANGPERNGTATVRFGKIEITPRPACLDTLEEQTFSATVNGIANQEVRWTTDAGTITRDGGEYKAPTTRPAAGYATIRATSTSDPALVGEIQVPIGCTCNFQFRLGATTIAAEQGDQMFFNSDSGRLIRVTVLRPSESWSLRMLPIDTDPVTWPNAPGAWPIRVQGTMGLSDPNDVIFSTDDEFAPVMDLEAYVPAMEVSGRVAGTVEVASTFAPRFLTFDWWFAIRYAPGQFMCTVPAP